MLEVLPLHALREEDGPLVGQVLLNLSKLAQNKIPVADGIVVIPPEFALQTILKHFEFKDKEVFEQRLEIFKSEVKKVPIPQILEKELQKRRIDSAKLWQHLLDFWLSEIRSKIWREGLNAGINMNLSAQTVLFTEEIEIYGKAYFDFEAKKVVIETQNGVLSQKLADSLEESVKSANKILLLPFVYDWIVEKRRLKFTKITPFTQLAESEVTQKPDYTKLKDDRLPSSSVKVFLHLDDTFVTEQNMDGFFISSQKINDWDRKIFQLLEASSISTPNGVIFQLADTQDQFGGIKGTLRLIHSPALLKKDVEAILFVRNKKRVLNCHIGIPFCRTVDEYLELKRQLMTLGINRSGNLHYNLELSVPENYINLENYINAGFDTAVLELDTLAAWLGGFDPAHHESFYYKKEIAALIKFIEPALELLNKNMIPFIAKGELALHDDVLSFLLEKGMWGIIAEHNVSTSIHTRIRVLEQRIFRRRATGTTKHTHL